MTSIVKLHTLSGAMDESPPCYVLQVDDFKFLLDCGWDEMFDMDFPKELKRHVNSIDAVLLTHPDPLHLGALPYAVGKLGLSCPIYATLPVYKMGQMFMYDLYQSHYNMEDFNIFTLDDVDMAFDRIIQLKYNQTVALKGKGLGLTITPLPAGHMIGGTIWKIVKEGEDDIVYAVDYNHKKERHLNGCELEKLLRPSVLITDALNANYQQPRRRTRDEKLMTTILSTLRGGGSVLVCVDTAGRVLELAHMLDQLWRNKESGLIAYSLLLLNNVSYNVIEFAKSQIEWMSDKLMRSFEGARNNPFQLKYLQLCHSVAEVQKTPGPKVVLASYPDLESGFARDLFIQWAPHQQNSIVLTSRCGPGTLARDLIENGGNRTIDLTVKKRVKLEGAELEEFMRTQKINQLVVNKKEEPSGISSDSESDSELEMSVITGRHDIIVRHNVARLNSFFKDNRRHHAMYPYHEERTRWDEYGEIIKLEDFRLTEVLDADGETRDVRPETPKPVENEKEIEIPTKCTVTNRSIKIQAWVQYIELEGRSDGESILRIVSQLRPRCVIGVRGKPDALTILRDHCINEGCEMVYTPYKGETVDATIESHIYQVKLTDALVSNLRWIRSGNLELAWLSGRLAKRELPEGEVESDQNKDECVMLEPAPPKPHRAAFFNELRLSDLKQSLAKHNFATEFSGGALTCCNGTLAIRRLDNGKVSLEGILSEEYYKVREILYDQFAIV